MKRRKKPHLVIIGAGPTGLGAAWRCLELDYDNWTLIDGAPRAGGLASSVVDENGFVWDMGGHVIFSHYDYFDQLLAFVMGDEWVEHVREAWVWMRERFIPYPLQNNIWRLPTDDLSACLDGLTAEDRTDPARVNNFEDWILCQFGKGLADVFFLPYNYKVWAYHPKKLDTCWMQERVATIDLERILQNIAMKKDDLGWGPNSRFRFPLRGGTGEIWRRLAAILPEEKTIMHNPVVEIDENEKTVRLSDGTSVGYDELISTMPLDVLLQRLKHGHAMQKEFQHRLSYSSTNIVGIGIRGTVPEQLRTKCWMYFPETDIPFYRATVFSNYSPNNVPDPLNNWSLMCEVSESSDKKVDHAALRDDVVSSLRRTGLLPKDAEVISLYQTRLDHGYPTPFLGRDSVLKPLNQALEYKSIYSRGRFGAWKYEVSNQDHSLMQGVELVDRLLLDLEEQTFNNPSVVNAVRNTTRQLGLKACSQRAQEINRLIATMRQQADSEGPSVTKSANKRS